MGAPLNVLLSTPLALAIPTSNVSVPPHEDATAPNWTSSRCDLSCMG